jgi:hypothetical protein
MEARPMEATRATKSLEDEKTDLPADIGSAGWVDGVDFIEPQELYSAGSEKCRTPDGELNIA